jgi:hypothetical protein
MFVVGSSTLTSTIINSYHLIKRSGNATVSDGKHLSQVFTLLQKNQLYAKLASCTFGQKQVEYLGHIIIGKCVSTDPVKIEDITKWHAPKTTTKLRSFIGLTSTE